MLIWTQTDHKIPPKCKKVIGFYTTPLSSWDYKILENEEETAIVYHMLVNTLTGPSREWFYVDTSSDVKDVPVRKPNFWTPIESITIEYLTKKINPMSQKTRITNRYEIMDVR